MGCRQLVLMFSILAGCVPATQPADVSASGRPSAVEPTAPAPAVEPVPPELYAPEEALRDALSGPLEIVGVGGWPGGRRLSCVYRNARVFVVEEACSDPREPSVLVVHVLSPARGRATLFAEASAPISSATRADYKAFGVASAIARPPPASLAVTMSYEEALAYETDPPGKVRGSCSAGTQRPEGFCSKELPTAAPDYAARTADFVREPPETWYELVRGLVALRAQAHASIRPAQLPPARLAAWGASWARDQEIDVDYDSLKRVGNSEGLSAPMAVTADGGAVIVGTTSQGGVTVPAVVRVDANATKLWQKPLPQKGFALHEGTSIIAAPDGAIVLAEGYPNPAWKPVCRVIKLDPKGKVAWQWLGHGKDKHKIPQIVSAQLGPEGTVLLRGYIQLVADGDVHAWNGELDRKGKLLREEVGAILPDHGASMQ